MPAAPIWTAGLNVIYHDVYFGTESEVVAESSRDNPVALVSQGQTSISYDPPTASYGETYWWRVDEIDSQSNMTRGDLWSFSTSPAQKGRSCFTPETLVWVDGAAVPIAQVRPAQTVGLVRSDADRGRTMIRPYDFGAVERLQEHEGVFTCYDVVLESGNGVTVASCHYFLSEAGRWIAARQLKTGTKLQTATGSTTVAAVYRRLKPYTGTVYNLKIEGSDRYLVGRDALIARDY